MRQAIGTFGRVLARHTVAMMAWYLAGEAVHRVLLQLAGIVGGYTTLGGLLLLPLAVAARLVSYVAMYLTVRPSLPNSSLAQRSGTLGTPGGYRAFADAVLVSILPFFAFYAAWGMLDADRNEFLTIASSIAIPDSGYSSEAIGDRGGLISVSAISVTVLVAALVVRIVLARLKDRLPAWAQALAVYAEVLWTFMLFTLVLQWWGGARNWLDQRAVAGWLRGIGDWFAANFAPVAVAWEAGTWLVGIVIAALLLPAAWLTVAGVIYGTTFGTEPRLGRWGEAALSGTARSFARSLVLRLESLWAAVSVIWRGGAALFGTVALVYALWALLERVVSRGVLQLIGGHDDAYWEAFSAIILVAIAAVFEPLRVAIVATAYDTVVGRPQAGLDAGTSGLDDEPRHDVVVSGHVEEEGTGIGGDEEHRDDVVRG